MSRFADPDAIARLDLGACQCPGTPHESDWLSYRTQLGYADIGRIAAVAATGDVMAAKRETLIVAVTSWNLLGPDGEVPSIDTDSVGALDFGTAEAAYDAINEAIAERMTVPNPSGARSRATSRASASRTRTPTPTPTTS